jgi:hypothetical protein
MAFWACDKRDEPSVAQTKRQKTARVGFMGEPPEACKDIPAITIAGLSIRFKKL